MRFKECDYKGCEEKSTSFVSKKQYCDNHYIIMKDKTRYERNPKVNKLGLCSIDGCNKRLGNTNKSGMCGVHIELQRIRNRKKKQK